LAGVKFLKQQVEEDQQVQLFSDLTIKHKEKSKKKQKNISLFTLKSASIV